MGKANQSIKTDSIWKMLNKKENRKPWPSKKQINLITRKRYDNIPICTVTRIYFKLQQWTLTKAIKQGKTCQKYFLKFGDWSDVTFSNTGDYYDPRIWLG